MYTSAVEHLGPFPELSIPQYLYFIYIFIFAFCIFTRPFLFHDFNHVRRNTNVEFSLYSYFLFICFVNFYIYILQIYALQIFISRSRARIKIEITGRLAYYSLSQL